MALFLAQCIVSCLGSPSAPVPTCEYGAGAVTPYAYALMTQHVMDIFAPCWRQVFSMARMSSVVRLRGISTVQWVSVGTW